MTSDPFTIAAAAWKEVDERIAAWRAKPPPPDRIRVVKCDVSHGAYQQDTTGKWKYVRVQPAEITCQPDTKPSVTPS